jgi:hypothetical protein
MDNQISLNEQATAIRNLLRWKYSLFSPHQLAQLEAIERTLFGMQDLSERLGTIYKEDAEWASDEMANQLVDLLQLQRA